MTLELNRVHDYQKGPGNTVVMRRINAATRIRFSAEHPPIFIQNGAFYGEGGQRIAKKDLPKEFWEHAAKLSDQVRRECGLDMPEEQSMPAQPARPGKPGKTVSPQIPPATDEVAALRSDVAKLSEAVAALMKMVGGDKAPAQASRKAPRRGKKVA